MVWITIALYVMAEVSNMATVAAPTDDTSGMATPTPATIATAASYSIIGHASTGGSDDVDEATEAVEAAAIPAHQLPRLLSDNSECAQHTRHQQHVAGQPANQTLNSNIPVSAAGACIPVEVLNAIIREIMTQLMKQSDAHNTQMLRQSEKHGAAMAKMAEAKAQAEIALAKLAVKEERRRLKMKYRATKQRAAEEKARADRLEKLHSEGTTRGGQEQ